MTVAELDLAKIEQFKMPRPTLGSAVLWYPHATLTERPTVGFVMEVGARNLTVQVQGVVYESVRHIRDPKLQLNEHQRENGAWEFPEKSDDGLERRVAALEVKVNMLTDLLEADTPKKGK